MAQELWLLRHGDAEDGAGDDAARRLTAKGEKQARAAGRALQALGVDFQAIVSSPRVRARDTATLAAAPLGRRVDELDALSAGFDRDDALHVLTGHGPDDRVLLVGHEPDFSRLVHDLTGARCRIRKGGLAVVAVARGGGELLALLRPADLARMGRA